jgi:propanediol dehydratase small subunit
LDQLTLEAVVAGEVDTDDLRISGETLKMQAAVAERAGFRQFTENLLRASELVGIPEGKILEIYEALRPRRSTHRELLNLADDLASTWGTASGIVHTRGGAGLFGSRPDAHRRTRRAIGPAT